MSDHAYDLLAWTLLTIASLILLAGIAEQVIQHVREERGRKARPLPGALGGDAWFAALPEHEKQAGAERLWEAVQSEPIEDELAAQIFHAQLADEARIWGRIDGSAS